METQTETPIAESPAPESAPPSPSDRLARMSPEETAEWRKSGTLPGQAPVVTAQGDGDSGDEEPEPETPPAPPPVGDAAASAAGKVLAAKKRTAQERINELTRDKYRLEGELHALRSQSSRPAAAEPEQPRSAPPPAESHGLVKPLAQDFSDYDEFTDALAQYHVRVAQATDRQQREQWQAQQREQQTVSAFTARVEAFKADKPDYVDVVSQPDLIAIATAQPYLHVAIRESEHGPAIAYYLGSHLEECRRLASQPNQAAFDRAFGRLEARFEAAGSAPSAASTPNYTTKAPAPPPTLGSRPAEPADGIEAALTRRDVGAYIREQNAREAAGRR
jgi:hypothetical protein